MQCNAIQVKESILIELITFCFSEEKVHLQVSLEWAGVKQSICAVSFKQFTIIIATRHICIKHQTESKYSYSEQGWQREGGTDSRFWNSKQPDSWLDFVFKSHIQDSQFQNNWFKISNFKNLRFPISGPDSKFPIAKRKKKISTIKM